MAWQQQYNDRRDHQPISVRKAGFAGYVNDKDHLDDMKELSHDEDGGNDFDEDLYEEARPEPTHEEEKHYEEHGEYPDSHYERHDQAYGEALHKKAQEDEPDHDDPTLMHFVGEHGDNPHLWRNKAHYGPVSLKQPVYATQSHVSQLHMDKYVHDPHAMGDHEEQHGDTSSSRMERYLGHDAPMFVTHEGRLHTTEGHHRVAAALRAGEPSIHGWHFNLDKHPEHAKNPREYDDGDDYDDPDD
jgi:hypothetical protein